MRSPTQPAVMPASSDGRARTERTTGVIPVIGGTSKISSKLPFASAS